MSAYAFIKAKYIMKAVPVSLWQPITVRSTLVHLGKHMAALTVVEIATLLRKTKKSPKDAPILVSSISDASVPKKYHQILVYITQNISDSDVR